jgi:hypothetical protein
MAADGIARHLLRSSAISPSDQRLGPDLIAEPCDRW